MATDLLFGILTYPLTLLVWLAFIVGCSYGLYNKHGAAMPIAPLRLFGGYVGAVLAGVVCAALAAYVTPEDAAQTWRVPPDSYWTAIRQQFLFTLAPTIMFSTAGIALVGVPVILRLTRAGRGSVGWILLASLGISLAVSLPLSAGLLGTGNGVRAALQGIASIAGAHLLMTFCFSVGAGLPWSAATPGRRRGTVRPL